MPRSAIAVDGGRVDLDPGFGTTGPGDRPVTGQGGEEPHRHLRAAGVVHAQEQHGGLAVVVQALDLRQRPQSLPGEPFGHQRQELDHGGPGGELVERGMQEPFDRLGAEDPLEFGGEPGRRGPQRE